MTVNLSSYMKFMNFLYITMQNMHARCEINLIKLNYAISSTILGILDSFLNYWWNIRINCNIYNKNVNAKRGNFQSTCGHVWQVTCNQLFHLKYWSLHITQSYMFGNWKVSVFTQNCTFRKKWRGFSYSGYMCID